VADDQITGSGLLATRGRIAGQEATESGPVGHGWATLHPWRLVTVDASNCESTSESSPGDERRGWVCGWVGGQRDDCSESGKTARARAENYFCLENKVTSGAKNVYVHPVSEDCVYRAFTASNNLLEMHDIHTWNVFFWRILRQLPLNEALVSRWETVRRCWDQLFPYALDTENSRLIWTKQSSTWNIVMQRRFNRFCPLSCKKRSQSCCSGTLKNVGGGGKLSKVGVVGCRLA
jgi:hypothetical protein